MCVFLYDMAKPIPKGVDDFKKFFEDDLYYVDKTDMIRQMIESPAEVFLFTRSRRFGKSLNPSMIDAFFNMKYEGNCWFDGLKVSSCTLCDKHKNAYPVIKINFKDMGKDYNQFINYMRIKMSALYLE